jgi:hypothetical protein
MPCAEYAFSGSTTPLLFGNWRACRKRRKAVITELMQGYDFHDSEFCCDCCDHIKNRLLV